MGEKNEYSVMKVKELRKIAKDLNIKYYCILTKVKLIEQIIIHKRINKKDEKKEVELNDEECDQCENQFARCWHRQPVEEEEVEEEMQYCAQCDKLSILDGRCYICQPEKSKTN